MTAYSVHLIEACSRGALIVAAGVLLPLAAAQAATPAVAIVNAQIFDGTGAAPYKGTLVVKDGRILDVGPAVKAPKGAQVIDAKGEALTPGFFDVHTHWTPAGAPNITPKIADAYVAADDITPSGISFLAMVFIGSMNKIFNKLETGPMYNYPNFLNLLTTFMYIPLSFAYVIPAIRAGWITG